eukprot:TRINITY_DN16871_c0_g1_i1.p1 TRINITY_DN16871_c0_g1~~TRINITY_DN16871_c0_g1_i1.p1  ORF type:complete len:409 (+),score=69.80 TRINITY_DN16871_c0_g1_i1:129-1229(+)
MPTFLVGEYVFIVLALLSFYHAFSNSRLHAFTWVMTFVVGTANDVIFMALPSVDNFWQAQATIMLTPRLPLYIPCVYNLFMYWPVVTSWRSDLSLLGKSAFAGILGCLLYAPYDMIGVKFLWWTWHDTYAGLRYRFFGVPMGSTLWTLTFVWAFSLLINSTTKEQRNIGFGRMLFSTVTSALFSTPLMMAVMGVIQLVGTEGLPSLPCFTSCFSLFVGIIAWDYIYRKDSIRGFTKDSLATFAMRFYVYSLVAIGLFGTPENHVSTGLHQRIGPCRVEQFDIITQTTQYEFLCPSEFTAVWDFSCTDVPSASSGPVEWYTVCGTPHDNQQLWLGVLFSILVVALRLATLGGTRLSESKTQKSNPKL